MCDHLKENNMDEHQSVPLISKERIKNVRDKEFKTNSMSDK